MVDRKLTIESLKYLKRQFREGSQEDQTIDDAIELLTSQQPRVMTLEEIISDYPMCWFENRSTHSGCHCQPMPAIDFSGNKVVDIMVFGSGTQQIALQEQYNVTWRCWTSRPTDEQREETPWD